MLLSLLGNTKDVFTGGWSWGEGGGGGGEVRKKSIPWGVSSQTHLKELYFSKRGKREAVHSHFLFSFFLKGE